MNEIGIHVRQATMADIHAVAVLFDAYRVFYERPSDPAAAASFIHDRLALRESVILIAERADGEAVGFTQLYPTFSSVRMRRLFVLNDLYVAKAGRKQGVGRMLLEAAANHARHTGAVGLELATATDNQAAKSVYEAMGWTLDTEFDHYAYTV